MKNKLWFRSKRVLSLLLVLAMVVTICLPVSGHAAATGNTVELTVGQSQKLYASSWFGSVIWTSSDTAVATVSANGTVTAVSAGTATVRATSYGFFGHGRTTTYTIVVTGGQTGDLHVTVGQTLPLSVDAQEGTVTWVSSDSAIATVDGSGVVTGVSVGEVTITATITKTQKRPFWFFWWGTGTTKTEQVKFQVTVLPGQTEPEVITYTVSFNTNGGTAVESQVVEKGLTASQPTNPIRTGYRFLGWYTDEDCRNAYDFNSPVTTDLTLYAGWEEESGEQEQREAYFVTFLLRNDADALYQTVTVTPGATVERPADPEMDGFAFQGWYTDADGLNAFDFQTPINDDLILFAYWGAPDGDESCPYGTSDGNQTIFSIVDIKVEMGEVVTTVNVNSTAVLHVEFLTDGDMQRLAEYAVQTPSYGELIQIRIPVEDELPQYFFVRATLLDGSAAVLATYTSIRYTYKYEQFEQKTVAQLREEGERVLSFTGENDKNFGVLADGVVEIFATETANVTTKQVVKEARGDRDWYEVYTVASPDETMQNVQIGDVIVIYGADGSNHILKVGEKQENADGSLVLIPAQGAQLSEFYKLLKVRLLSNDDQITTYALRGRDEDLKIEETISKEIDPDLDTWEPVENVSIGPSLTGKASVELEIMYDFVLFGEDYMSCTVALVLELEVGFKVEISIDNEDEADSYIKSFREDYELPDIDIPTPIAGLTAFVEISFPIEWEISAGGVITITATTKSGFSYDTINGKQEIDEKKVSAKVGLEGSASLKAGPKISLGLAYLGDLLEASIGVWVGAQIEISAFVGHEVDTSGEPGHACQLCLEGTVRWFLDVVAELEYCIIEDILEDKPIDETLFTLDGHIDIGGALPGKYYFSIINDETSIFGGSPHFGVDECPNVKHRVNIETRDENAAEVTGVRVEVKQQFGQSMGTVVAPGYIDLYEGAYTATAIINGNRVIVPFKVTESRYVILRASSRKGTLDGKVVDAQNGNPLAGATIMVAQDDLIFTSTVSNANGAYNLSLPEGTYQVTVKKQGYVALTRTVTIENGQVEYVETAMMIVGNGQNMGGLSGTITDAVTGNPVAGVTIALYHGWNNSGTGAPVATLTTDSYGNYVYETRNVMGIIFGLSSGNYTARASKSGYAATSFNVVVVPGESRGGQDATMSPVMTGDGYRVVLRWDENPFDLDSHFNGLTVNGVRDHIWYSEKVGITGNLDRDDTDSYGPETITVTDFASLQNGFTYSIHDFTNCDDTYSTALSESGAYVELYEGDQLLRTYHVPTGRDGTVWNVFSIDGNGQITSLNTFDYEQYADQVGVEFVNG